AGIAVFAGACATIWCATQPVPDRVVNNSHPAHLLVGLAWLSMFVAPRPLNELVAATRPARAFISELSQRTITVYLWHSTAVIVAFEVLRRADIPFPPGGWVVALL